MNVQLHAVRGKPMHLPLKPPLTQESIQDAKEWQTSERRAVARELAVPSELWALYETHGDQQMRSWIKLIETLRS